MPDALYVPTNGPDRSNKYSEGSRQLIKLMGRLDESFRKVLVNIRQFNVKKIVVKKLGKVIPSTGPYWGLDQKTGTGLKMGI